MQVLATHNDDTFHKILKCIERAKCVKLPEGKEVHLRHCQYQLSEGDDDKELIRLLAGLGYMSGVNKFRIMKICWKDSN